MLLVPQLVVPLLKHIIITLMAGIAAPLLPPKLFPLAKLWLQIPLIPILTANGIRPQELNFMPTGLPTAALLYPPSLKLAIPVVGPPNLLEPLPSIMLLVIVGLFLMLI